MHDHGVRVDLAYSVGKNFALGLRDDVSLGDDDNIGHFQHRSDLFGSVDPAQVVDHADSQNTLDMRGATVAEPGAFDDQQVKPLLYSPGKAVTGIADKEMVRTEIARQAGCDRYALFFEKRLILGGEAVELHDADMHAFLLQRSNGLDGDGGFARGGGAGYGDKFHEDSP